MNRNTLASKLISATLCTGIVLAGCTQTSEPVKNEPPRGTSVALTYDYTVEQNDGHAVFVAKQKGTDVRVATLTVDESGKGMVFDRGDDHMSMDFSQTSDGRFVASGTANGEEFSLSMKVGQVETLTVTGASPEIARLFALANETFPDMAPLAAAAGGCWWVCGECAAVLAGIGLTVWALWPVIVPFAALVASHGAAAVWALTAAELAGLLGISTALAAAILGPCKNCFSCLMGDKAVACADTDGDIGAARTAESTEAAIECDVLEATNAAY
jgi:hypothetical protein